MKTLEFIRQTLLASTVFLLLPHSATALRFAVIGSDSRFYIQESSVGAPLGKLNVPPKSMSSRCTTMVSPNYPQSGGSPRASTVIVRVVIWKSGNVTPMRVVSGEPSLETEAMNAVRLWRYKPYSRDGELLDVTTDVEVDFDPGKPGGTLSHPNH
jgi:TonB family protein